MPRRMLVALTIVAAISGPWERAWAAPWCRQLVPACPDTGAPPNGVFPGCGCKAPPECSNKRTQIYFCQGFTDPGSGENTISCECRTGTGGPAHTTRKPKPLCLETMDCDVGYAVEGPDGQCRCPYD